MQKIKITIASNSDKLLNSNIRKIASAQKARDSQILSTGQTLKTENSPFSSPEYAISFRSGFYLSIASDEIPSSFDPAYPPQILFRVALPQGKRTEIEKIKTPSLINRLGKAFLPDGNQAHLSFDPQKPEEQLYDVLEISIPLKVISEGYLEINQDSTIEAVRLYDDYKYMFAMNRILEFANPSFPICQEPQQSLIRLEETPGLFDELKKIQGGIESSVLNRVFKISDSTEIMPIESYLKQSRIAFNSRYDPIKPKEIDLVLTTGQILHSVDSVCRPAANANSQNIFRPIKLFEIYMINASDQELVHNNDISALLIEEIRQNILNRGVEIFDSIVAPKNQFVPTELLKMSFQARTQSGAMKLGIVISEMKNGQNTEIITTINYQSDPWGGSSKNLAPEMLRRLSEGYRLKTPKQNLLTMEKRAEYLKTCIDAIGTIINSLSDKGSNPIFRIDG